jgi:hypothetical protein
LSAAWDELRSRLLSSFSLSIGAGTAGRSPPRDEKEDRRRPKPVKEVISRRAVRKKKKKHEKIGSPIDTALGLRALIFSFLHLSYLLAHKRSRLCPAGHRKEKNKIKIKVLVLPFHGPQGGRASDRNSSFHLRLALPATRPSLFASRAQQRPEPRTSFLSQVCGSVAYGQSLLGALEGQEPKNKSIPTGFLGPQGPGLKAHAPLTASQNTKEDGP